jgi:hypothetical protein
MNLDLGLGSQGGANNPNRILNRYMSAVNAKGGSAEVRYQANLLTFITTLFDAGIWQRLDCLYLANYEGVGSRVNLIDPAVSAAVINALGFTDKLGWKAVSAGNALNLNYNPTTTKHFTAGRGTLFTYLTSAFDAGSGNTTGIIGAQETTSAKRNVIIRSQSAPRPLLSRLYQDGRSTLIYANNQAHSGFVAVANDTNQTFSGAYQTTRSVTANTDYGINKIADLNFYGCALNITGSVAWTNLVTSQGCFGVGDFLCATETGKPTNEVWGEMRILRNALVKYFTDIAGA